MKILIVGSNGFIGSNLLKFLVKKGQQIRVLNRSNKNYTSTSINVECTYGDFANTQTLNDSLRDIDIVYHLASSSIPSTSNANPIDDIETNLIGTVKLLQACVKKSVKKVIFASSGGTIYGIPQEIPIRENHPTNPICSYGINKLAIEKYLQLFKHLYGLDHTILRLSNPYGVGQNPQGQVGAITIFLNKIFHKQPIQIWGDGEIIRDYIYIDDVVNAFYLAQFNTKHQEKIFNIGSGYGLTLNQLIKLISEIINIDFEVNYIQARKSDIPVNCLANENAKQVLSWQPTVNLECGINKTWQWVRNFYL